MTIVLFMQLTNSACAIPVARTAASHASLKGT
jgi:hypothetical protein